MPYVKHRGWFVRGWSCSSRCGTCTTSDPRHTSKNGKTQSCPQRAWEGVSEPQRRTSKDIGRVEVPVCAAVKMCRIFGEWFRTRTIACRKRVFGDLHGWGLRMVSKIRYKLTPVGSERAAGDIQARVHRDQQSKSLHRHIVHSLHVVIERVLSWCSKQKLCEKPRCDAPPALSASVFWFCSYSRKTRSRASSDHGRLLTGAHPIDPAHCPSLSGPCNCQHVWCICNSCVC